MSLRGRAMLASLCVLVVLSAGCKVECDPWAPDSRQCEELKRAAERAQEQAGKAAEQAAREMADQARRAAEEEGRRTVDRLADEAKRRAAQAAEDARNRLPQIGNSLSGDGPFQLGRSPVPLDKITSINWYGNTQFAYDKRADLYGELQGLHSGVDFLVPLGTPITSVVNRTGTVLSVSNARAVFAYKAGPENVLVNYGDFLVLYGHTSKPGLPAVGATFRPGDVVAYTGVDDDGLAHLHLEVIRKHESWDKLPPDKQATTRPGNVRTNPVVFFSAVLRRQLATKQWDTFHKLTDGRWQTPEDQPDITPGGQHLVP